MGISVEEFNRLREKVNAEAEESYHTHHGDPEFHLQCLCVNWFHYTYPEHYIVASANGGKRDRVTAAKLKASGVQAGEPDLKIGVARHGFNHLYIEMKNGKQGRVSPAQQKMIEYYRAQGSKVEVVRTYDEFVKIVTDYMSE